VIPNISPAGSVLIRKHGHVTLTANKIGLIEQLAYKKKVFIVVLQDAHCTQASDSEPLTSWVNPD